MIAWDGANQSGRPAPPGTYWIRLAAGRTTASTRVVLIR